MGKKKKIIINFILLVLGCFLIALTFNVFCVPNSYVTGGVSGIAVIFNYLLCLQSNKIWVIIDVYQGGTTKQPLGERRFWVISAISF